MNTSVWLIDLRGQAELPEGSSDIDGIIIRPSDRAVLGIGVKTGFFSKRTHWAAPDQLVRADGTRTWLSASSSELKERPPEGVWLRADLVARCGTEPLGAIGWAGVSDGIVLELGILPIDPRRPARRVKASEIRSLNDRSVDLAIADLDDAPQLKTDRELEEEVRRRLWETDGSLPHEALERITVQVEGGIVILGGMVPRNSQRALALAIGKEPLEVRGVVNRIETAEGIAESSQRLQP